MYSTTWIAAAVRSVLYASALSAGVLLCASSAHADDRDQLKSIQADIAAEGSGRLSNSSSSAQACSPSSKRRKRRSPPRPANCAKPEDSLNQLNKQIDEMNAALAKLERQRASQERNLAAQLDAAFRRGSRIPASRWCSAVKRASAISGCRSISAISTEARRGRLSRS